MTDLEFFDANVVVGRVSRPSPTMRCEPEEIVSELARHDITEALVTHAHALERSHEDNVEVLDLVRAHPGLRPAWVVPEHSTLDFPDPDAAISQMLADDVGAVRVPASRYNGYTVDPWALGPIWSRFDAVRMPVLLAGSDLGRYPDGPALGFSARNIFDMATSFPGIPLIILRVNFSALRVLVPLMRACPNVFAELSFFTAHHGVETLVRELGADRLLFGSGLPWGPPGPSLVATRYARVADADKRLIAGDNLRRLLGDIRS
ncbi:amidohydrolase family protein [Agromyces aerolatus]|uniref:amidohydrolase family protein n=1 Tax=Agromyces sp. LY-1074 TaxID=3074080 RepID=UPI0028675112|nr:MULTISPECIES: amidohydrolase family protein [unclassified Agromyces]MDR5700846.1 amidohydrolase family protein [Agromyces sp. LY-1074]MDR5707493.1 amidohydrolase family protein [Agromyces sp. LY-1358]